MLGEESGIRETFWPTVGMVEPALGGSGPLGRYSDFTFSRSVYYGGERGGNCVGEEGERQTVFPALSRPSSLDRGGSALAEVGGGEGLTAGCWNVGEDLQDRVFLFAGGVVVDVFCEMVHFGCVCVCVDGGWGYIGETAVEMLASAVVVVVGPTEPHTNPNPLLNDTPLYSAPHRRPPAAPTNIPPLHRSICRPWPSDLSSFALARSHDAFRHFSQRWRLTRSPLRLERALRLL